MWMRTDFMRKGRQVNDVTRAIHVLQDSLYDGWRVVMFAPVLARVIGSIRFWG